MKNFLWQTKEKLEELAHLDRETLLYRVMPQFVLEIMHKYFRLEVEGTEFIPKKGPVLIAPNHSGYSGFDAMLLTHAIHQATGRYARVLTHQFWFLNETTAIPAKKLGFIEASRKNGIENLKKGRMVVIFPEGESGNFKPSFNAYNLQPFKRGLVRMALKTKTPIVPTIVIGAEETHINLSQLKLTKYLKGLIIPLPLNIIPLPAKWKIKFLPPIHLPYKTTASEDRELVYELSSDLREKMQVAMNDELKKRDSIFI